MKKSMKVLVAMMFVLFTFNLSAQETIETSPPKVEKNLLGMYLNSTYIIFTEIGLTYERALSPNWSVTIGMSQGMVFDLTYSRVNLGIKHKFKKRDFLDTRRYKSLFVELETGLVRSGFVPSAAVMSATTFRLGHYSELKNNFVFQFAAGVGGLSASSISDGGSGESIGIVDARITLGYRF